MMVIVAGMTAVCEVISYILQIVIFKMEIEVLMFLKIVGIEIVYNTMIVIIIYPLIQKAGSLIERIFAENKIMTRYF